MKGVLIDRRYLHRLDSFLRQNTFLFVILLLIVEFVLNLVIIKKVKYTEIDWVAYMQEVKGYLDGQLDYLQLYGNTGPLVYPAGFVYIYSILRYFTQEGVNILFGQYIFLGLYLLNFLIIAGIYLKSDVKVPIWTLGILTLSKRIHSLFVLRMFNDCIAVLIGYAALLLFMSRRYRSGSVVYSLAVSVKMNILLSAPGLLLVLLLGTGLYETIICLSICATVQLVLGYPFLSTYPVSYLSRSFDLGRVFMYKWTVNFKFLPEEVFISKPLSIFLLLLTLMGMIALWVKVLCRSHIKSISQLLSKKECKLSSHFVAYTILTSNFIGVCFARSLHYQFYSWYFHSLPYLLWTGTSLPLDVRFAVLIAVEIAFNVYPATYWSSLLLQAAHMLTLIAIFLHPAPLITDNSSDLHEKDKDEEDDKEVQRVLHASDSFDLNSMRLRSRRLKSK